MLQSHCSPRQRLHNGNIVVPGLGNICTGIIMQMYALMVTLELIDTDTGRCMFGLAWKVSQAFD